jgi:hypothetical protein
MKMLDLVLKDYFRLKRFLLERGCRELKIKVILSNSLILPSNKGAKSWRS